MAAQQGWSQQTPAVQTMLRTAVGTARRNTRTATKRRRKASTVKAAKRVRRAASKLKKGSAAAKRYMAKIRAMRKK